MSDRQYWGIILFFILMLAVAFFFAIKEAL
jgi:hypothetical protein